MKLMYLPVISNLQLDFVTNSISKSLTFKRSKAIEDEWIQDAKNFLLNPRSVALSAGRESAWNDGWALCLKEAKETSSIESFYPHYIRNASDIFLVNGVPSKFENDSPELLMASLSADNILAIANSIGANCIVEIGCGTGWRLELLRRRGWKGQLLGSDFAKSSKHCIDVINTISAANIEFKEYNMLEIQDFVLPKKTLLYTYGALEQIGNKWGNFHLMCRSNNDNLLGCMHFEPFSSMYNITNQFDRYSLAIHKAKNYLDGYLENLISEYCQNNIELTITRLPLGSKFLETANYAGWSYK